MKTRMTQLVAALFFVLVFAGNVNATEHDVKASSHESIETSLEFENWMMDEYVWSTANFVGTAADATLDVENWMTNELVWEVENNALLLEEWMTDNTVWDLEQEVSFVTENDSELAMEQWMVKQNIWEI